MKQIINSLKRYGIHSTKQLRAYFKCIYKLGYTNQEAILYSLLEV